MTKKQIAPSFTFTTTVSPSPREIVARLPVEEVVAIDLLIQAEGRGELPPATSTNYRVAVPADARLAELVPDPKRRTYLAALALQLRALGFSLHEAPALDAAVQAWNIDRQRQADEYRRYEEARQRSEQERLAAVAAADAALPPTARRAVQRRRRKQARRSR